MKTIPIKGVFKRALNPCSMNLMPNRKMATPAAMVWKACSTLMAALAEGLNILDHADLGLDSHDPDAETAPLRAPEYYRFDIDIPAAAEVVIEGLIHPADRAPEGTLVGFETGLARRVARALDGDLGCERPDGGAFYQ